MSEERNKHRQSCVENEQGFILIVTMLVLVVLTVLCIGALDNSTFEVQIAANDRQSRVAFNVADGGVNATGDLIEETFDGIADPDYAANGLEYINVPRPTTSNYTQYPPLDGFITVNVADEFYLTATGLMPPSTPPGDYDFMLRAPNAQGDMFGRITAHRVDSSAGGNAEAFIGTINQSGKKGVEALIDIDIDSFSTRNSRSSLAMRYRYLLK